MPRRQKTYFHPDKAKRYLRVLLAFFVLALSLPVYLLLEKVYSQLENEAWFNQRNQAEILIDRIEHRLQETLEEEETRPIAEYSFFNILESPLLKSSAVKFSPLSEIPPRTKIPGMTGFFQINPDGSFHIPALPDLDQELQPSLGQQELSKRIALKENLRRLLSVNETFSDRSDQSVKQKKRQDLRDAKAGSKAKTREGYRMDDHFQTTESDSVSSDTEPFKVQPKKDIALTDSRTNQPVLSEEMLNELNIDADRWKQKRSLNEARKNEKLGKASESQYRSRKEVVKLPDQSIAGALFKRPKQASAPSLYSESLEEKETQSSVAQQTEPFEAHPSQEQPPLKILSIESEVSPLQLTLLNDQYLCFYRRVWHANGRYIQGFIVNSKKYFSAAVLPILKSSGIENFSSLLIAYDGMLLEQFKTSKQHRETLLYRQSLISPFQRLELIVNTGSILAGPGALVVDSLAFVLGLVLLGGVFLFYRLGSRQIELARQQRNFISAVSHELKTPITSIRMYGEMLRSQWVPDENRKRAYYDYIFFESERLSRLIDNVLQLARLENHSEKTLLTPQDPYLLLQRIRDKTQIQAEAAGFQLNLIYPENREENSTILIDEDAFFQIMINLIDNAIKFSNEADKKMIDIGLKIANRGKDAIYTIRDFGPGIEKKQIKKIFRLFYRAGDELTRSTTGTGIGLALVVQLVEQMNAKIDLLNRDPGIEFQIQFMLKK